MTSVAEADNLRAQLMSSSSATLQCDVLPTGTEMCIGTEMVLTRLCDPRYPPSKVSEVRVTVTELDLAVAGGGCHQRTFVGHVTASSDDRFTADDCILGIIQNQSGVSANTCTAHVVRVGASSRLNTSTQASA